MFTFCQTGPGHCDTQGRVNLLSHGDYGSMGGRHTQNSITEMRKCMQNTWPGLVSITNSSTIGIPGLASLGSSFFWVVINLGMDPEDKPLCCLGWPQGSWNLLGHPQCRSPERDRKSPRDRKPTGPPAEQGQLNTGLCPCTSSRPFQGDMAG